MRKIMFNDRYGLTAATLRGDKTMTRRIIPIDLYNQIDWKAVAEGNFEAVVDGEGYYHDIRCYCTYKVGDVVAIAQSYKAAGVEPSTIVKMIDEGQNMFTPVQAIESAGWENKMYVRADLMPNQIRITDLWFERLQDISDEDCLKEGLLAGKQEPKMYGFKLPKGTIRSFMTPRDAFAALIDRISGRGTWESNPWVIAYTYELVKED